MPAAPDHYQLLGVDRSATDEEIRRAYRRLARELHPDVNKAPDAAERFARVTEAYDILSDAEKRAAYDRGGHHAQWHTAGHTTGRSGPGPGPDLGSIFEELFGRSGPGSEFGFDPGSAGARDPFGRAARRSGPRPARGADREIDLKVSFLTAARGGTETLRARTSEGRERTIDVRIPAGVAAGAKLRVVGEGLPGAQGGPPGDLIVRIDVGKHPRFRREGLDLITDVTISFPQAALGAEVEVPLLEGSATLRIPPGTPSGRRLRLRGHGIRAEDGRIGDLHASVKIDVPAELDAQTRSLIEALADRLPPAARPGEHT